MNIENNEKRIIKLEHLPIDILKKIFLEFSLYKYSFMFNFKNKNNQYRLINKYILNNVTLNFNDLIIDYIINVQTEYKKENKLHNIIFNKDKILYKNNELIFTFLNELTISYPYIKDLNHINNYFPNLKILDVTHSTHLIEIPKIITLEQLKCVYCRNLNKIPNDLINLKYLNISNTIKIKTLPNDLINLKILNASESELQLIPNTLINLERINIDINHNIKQINDFKNLIYFSSRFCKNINNINKNLYNLKELHLTQCNIIELPESLINLEILGIEGIKNIKYIPNTYKKLIKLYCFDCHSLIKIPKTFINLEILEARECRSLINIPKELVNLKYVDLAYCQNISTISENLINIKELDIHHVNINFTIPDFFLQKQKNKQLILKM